MGRLVLVRHGESVFNAQGRIQGQGCAGLTALGHAQARATARWLAASLPRPAHLVTSDLQRARETAMPLASALGIVPRDEPNLRERSCGAWDGLSPAEIAEADPARWKRWQAREDVFGEVGGESADTLTARVVTVLEDLLRRSETEGVIVVVTHGGPCWYGMHQLLDLPAGTLRRPGNAAICELSERDGHRRLDGWNGRGHLVDVTEEV